MNYGSGLAGQLTHRTGWQSRSIPIQAQRPRRLTPPFGDRYSSSHPDRVPRTKLLEIPSLRHEYVRVNGTETAYSVAGDGGTPVVLVHGGAGDRRDWSKNIAALSSYHRVFAPDLIGYGDTARPNVPYTIDRFAGFLREFMDRVGIERACLVGHSLGGRVALEVACRAPERVARLVLVAPIGFGRLSPIGFALGTAGWALFKAIRRPLPYPPLEIELYERDHGPFREVRAPTLILWGRWDTYFPAWYSGRTRDAIPDSRVRLFNRSGHAPHKDESSSFNSTLLDFLCQSEPPMVQSPR